MSAAHAPEVPDVSAPSVVHAHTAHAFCDHLLDHDRWWPVVVVTRPQDGGALPIEVDDLCRSVGSAAEVAVIMDHDATLTLTDRLGTQLTCYWGAIRVVPPLGQAYGLLASNLFVLWKLRQLGQEAALAAVRRSVDYVVAEVARSRRRPHATRTRAPQRQSTPGSRTPEDVLHEVVPLCSSLEFLPSAHASAAKSPYRWLTRLKEQLMMLNATAEEMFGGNGEGQGWYACARKRGVEWRSSISPTTLGMYGTSYHFGSGSERQLYEAHVTLANGQSAGNCICIHMRPDPERRKLMVAYVGIHLPYAGG